MMSDVNLHDEVVQQNSGASKTRRNVLIAVTVVVVSLLIAIPIIVTTGNNDSNDYGSPQDPNGILKDFLVEEYARSDLLDLTTLNDRDSPQYKAYRWLSQSEAWANAELSYAETLQRYALAVLYHSTNEIKTRYSPNAPKWKDSLNWMTDEKLCSWSGVSCNEDEFVTGISLADNGLTGALPPETLFFARLETLDLSSNYLHIEGPKSLAVLGAHPNLKQLIMDDNYVVSDDGLPESLANLSKLEKLVMSYNVLRGPMDNGVLENLGKLTHLELESNELSGPIPPVIGTMESLIYLYMRRNALTMNLDFLKLGKMKRVFSMWLDSNSIVGAIPTEIGLFTDLASISLTDTGLTGTLPTEIGNLKGLRRFWIYSNKLEGTIPTEMASLPILEVFETQENDLVGEMPTGVCTAVRDAEYVSKSLSADCDEVECREDCCTDCY